jgi:hypothetical protein
LTYLWNEESCENRECIVEGIHLPLTTALVVVQGTMENSSTANVVNLSSFGNVGSSAAFIISLVIIQCPVAASLVNKKVNDDQLWEIKQVNKRILHLKIPITKCASSCT